MLISGGGHNWRTSFAYSASAKTCVSARGGICKTPRDPRMCEKGGRNTTNHSRRRNVTRKGAMDRTGVRRCKEAKKKRKKKKEWDQPEQSATKLWGRREMGLNWDYVYISAVKMSISGKRRPGPSSGIKAASSAIDRVKRRLRCDGRVWGGDEFLSLSDGSSKSARMRLLAQDAVATVAELDYQGFWAFSQRPHWCCGACYVLHVRGRVSCS
jgi:hypothetical protein